MRAAEPYGEHDFIVLPSEKGTLESFQVISTLPAGFEGDNTTAEIRVTPDGKHLYASNRGHDSLALFEVADDGTLTAKGHFATEAVPRFFALDPTGRFLYSAGQKSGRLASYRIDADTGVLEPLEVHEVGDCEAVGYIHGAMHAGHKVGRLL